MSRPSSKRATLLLACGLAAAGAAWALKSDKSQPINVHADHGDFQSDPKDNSNGTGVYTGNVVITQGSIKLTAKRAVLHVLNNELDTADVTGDPATFEQQPDNGAMVHGTAKEITYDASKNELMLITDAQLSQAVDQLLTSKQPGAAPKTTPAERLMSADRIRYETDTQRVVAKAGSDEQRVHISFPPKVLAPSAGTAAAPARHHRDAPAPATLAAPASATHTPAAATRAPAPAAATHAGTPS